MTPATSTVTISSAKVVPRAKNGAPVSRARAGSSGHDNFFHVSTRGLDQSERFTRWERHNAELLFGFSARSLDERPFDASEATLKLPSITLAHVTAHPHVIERNQRHIEYTGAEGVMLFFSLVGDAFFHHRGGNHSQRPGTLLVCDASRPFLRGFAHGLQEYAVTVPRALYESCASTPVPKEPVVMSFASPLDQGPALAHANPNASALASLLHERLAPMSEAEASDTEDRFLEIMGAMLSPEDESSTTARVQSAQVFIRRRFKDPLLSVRTVAEGIGVSERSLARAFASTGQGVARTILEVRLNYAHRLLRSPGAPTVQEVSSNCGFVNATHFSRVFRDRYGATPSEVRAGNSAESR